MANSTGTNTSQSKTFSSIVQQERIISRDHAIVVDTIKEKTVEEYAVALAKVVPPKEILYVSRISQNRVCFYLSKTETVDSLVEKEIKIKIEDQLLEIRPLTSKAKRILISNVQPCIPTSVILEELRKIDIIPVSQITTIKAGIHMPELGHLLSFRKQMFLKPEDIEKLPSNLKITYEDVNYWIYFSSEKMICFQCNEEGHLARFCPLNPAPSANNLQVAAVDDKNTEPYPTKEENRTAEANALRNPNTQTSDSRNKRPLSTSTQSTSNNDNSAQDTLIEHENFNQPIKPKKKKGKLGSKIDFAKHLEPARNVVERRDSHFPLNFDKLVAFLESTHGCDNIHDTAQMFTNSTESLSNMLSLIYPSLENRHAKSRVTRIRNLLMSKANVKSLNDKDDSSSVYDTDDMSEDGNSKINQKVHKDLNF